jgi:hypothetical protein
MGFLGQRFIASVPYDPHDRQRRLPILVHAEPSDALSDGIVAGPECPCRRLIHKGDLRTIGQVGFVEKASA